MHKGPASEQTHFHLADAQTTFRLPCRMSTFEMQLQSKAANLRQSACFIMRQISANYTTRLGTMDGLPCDSVHNALKCKGIKKASVCLSHLKMYTVIFSTGWPGRSVLPSWNTRVSLGVRHCKPDAIYLLHEPRQS
jgi:hypothetical protein